MKIQYTEAESLDGDAKSNNSILIQRCENIFFKTLFIKRRQIM